MHSTRNRKFESISLQRRVLCEPDFLNRGAENIAERWPTLACKANIARARELIAASVAVTDPPAEHYDPDLDVSAASDHRPLCPCCGGRMIVVESFGRGGAPRGPPSPEATMP